MLLKGVVLLHMSKVITAKLRVRYYETDQMGVVHHSNYIRWFELGRTELLRSLGSDYRAVEDKGMMLPVIDVSCKYYKPALYDDVVEIKTIIKQYSGVKMVFYYEAFRNNELLVAGETSHCWTDQQLKPIPLKKKWLELHQLIENSVSH